MLHRIPLPVMSGSVGVALVAGAGAAGRATVELVPAVWEGCSAEVAVAHGAAVLYQQAELQVHCSEQIRAVPRLNNRGSR